MQDRDDTTERPTFGALLKHYRQAADLSQEQLAFEAEMKRSYLSDLERGTRNPSVRALGRLAEALGVEPPELLRRSDQIES